MRRGYEIGPNFKSLSLLSDKGDSPQNFSMHTYPLDLQNLFAIFSKCPIRVSLSAPKAQISKRHISVTFRPKHNSNQSKCLSYQYLRCLFIILRLVVRSPSYPQKTCFAAISLAASIPFGIFFKLNFFASINTSSRSDEARFGNLSIIEKLLSFEKNIYEF